MTSTPSEELLSCPFCGDAMRPRHALWPCEGDSDGIIHANPTECPAEGFSIGTADEGVSVAAAWNRRSPSRREVLEEAARVADEAQATAREEIALEKAEVGYDPYTFGPGFLSGEITASANIAKAIRALAEEK